MESNLYQLRLPHALARAAQQIAAQRDLTVGQLLRDLLAAEISRAGPDDAAQMPPQQRKALGQTFDIATGWDDLQRRLAEHRMRLMPAGNGLALYPLEGDSRICKIKAIGQSYAALVSRFGAPFPSHPHAWMAERMMAAPEEHRLNHVIDDGRAYPDARTLGRERM